LKVILRASLQRGSTTHISMQKADQGHFVGSGVRH
jgi:hypothetical protein